LKIDIYPHFLPARYREELYRKAKEGFYLRDVNEATPTLWDLDMRFRIMDKYEDLKRVLTVASPPIEDVVNPEDAAELSELANDEMAELVAKYPDRFAAAVACLPMNSLDAALKETDRAIKELGFKGVQIYTPTNDKPLDLPEFMPLYEKMAHYDLPIWIHPCRGRSTPDYKTEDHSRYWIFSMFGWPYETTAAMTRLVFSGVLQKYPSLKFITHHCGGMIPFFAERISGGQDYAEVCLKAKFKRGLSRSPIEYYRMFYADTAIYGHTPGLMCGYSFFGPEHLVFGTDMPYDSENGDRYTRDTIDAIERMDITTAEKVMIYEGNTKRLLHI
jgi:aminocarboxymuconate-semialdehyde decarboxylase